MKSLLIGIKYGLIGGLIVILLWYLWAAFVYRYSVERLSNLVLNKYKSMHSTTLELFIKDIQIGDQVTATIGARDKIDPNKIDALNDKVSYRIGDIDSCRIYDFNCIIA
jgi:hypothetical protein